MSATVATITTTSSLGGCRGLSHRSRRRVVCGGGGFSSCLDLGLLSPVTAAATSFAGGLPGLHYFGIRPPPAWCCLPHLRLLAAPPPPLSVGPSGATFGGARPLTPSVRCLPLNIDGTQWAVGLTALSLSPAPVLAPLTGGLLCRFPAVGRDSLSHRRPWHPLSAALSGATGSSTSDCPTSPSVGSATFLAELAQTATVLEMGGFGSSYPVD